MCLPTKPFKIEREWEHAGLHCAVTQGHEAGHRCGYVRVPPRHWAFGKHYEEVHVQIHGGLTFAEPEPCNHEDGAGWWLGFDCGHMGRDRMDDPNMDPKDCKSEDGRMMLRIHRKYLPMNFVTGHYWTQVEVERECEKLAEQLQCP